MGLGFNLKHAARQFKQLLTGAGHGDLFAVPVEQPHIIFGFKLAHLVGYGWLCQVQSLGRARESAMDRHIVKGAELHVTQLNCPVLSINQIQQ